MDRNVRYLTGLGLILAALWLALSGVYKPLMLGLGAASIGLVLWLTWRMEIVGAEHDPVVFSWRLPLYWGWLVGQIISANIDVIRCILDPSRVAPQTLHVSEPDTTSIGVVTYGNSITLTPGTVTLNAEAGRLTVHALHQSSADELRSGQMAAWVRWLDTGESAHGERGP